MVKSKNISAKFNPSCDKTPKTRVKVSTTKNPKAIEPTNHDVNPIVWSFSNIDTDGRWGFHIICKDRLHQLITTDLKNKEGLNWAQIKQSGSHSISWNNIIKDAQKRLRDLRLDDLEDLFSLRFSGEARLWGFRKDNVFKILWWDPKHEICPSKKKHT